MKIAAIDIGTNSVRYLLVSKEEDSILELEEYCETTRLGENLELNSVINEQAYLRTEAVLIKFVNFARNNGAEVFKVIATNALRNAKNGAIILARLKTALNLTVHIISGNEEAHLAFAGATYLRQNKSDLVVVDIGGGSTEFVFSDKLSRITEYSLEIGAVRLTENCITSEPLNEADYEKIKSIVTQQIKKIEWSKIKQRKLIGVGGTITTLAAISLGLDKYDSNLINNYILTKLEIRRLLKCLKKATLAEKKEMVAIDPSRADILLSGTMILAEVLETTQATELVVSTYGILWGLVI